MKSLTAALVIVLTAFVPAFCYAHAGHGPEVGFVHELTHTQSVLVGFGCVAVLALIHRSRTRNKVDSRVQTQAERNHR